MSQPVETIETSNAARDREGLARSQAALNSALNSSAPVPEGFDAGQIRTAADSLARKRARSVQKAWPATAAALDQSFELHFGSYCAVYPAPPESPFLDGLQFVRWLEGLKLLPPDGRVELKRWRVYRDGIPRIVRLDRVLVLLLRTRRSVRAFRVKF